MTVEELQWHKSENSFVWQTRQFSRACLHLKWEVRRMLLPVLGPMLDAFERWLTK